MTPPLSDRDELRRLIADLEDRRALYNPYNIEAPILVEQSVQDIRGELTRTLQTISEGARAREPLQAMRAACRKYLDKSQDILGQGTWNRPPRWRGYHDGHEDGDFILALGELRGVFGACIGQLAAWYGIEVHGDLAGLLVAADDA